MFILTSTSAFDLDKSKILSFGKEWNNLVEGILFNEQHRIYSLEISDIDFARLKFGNVMKTNGNQHLRSVVICCPQIWTDQRFVPDRGKLSFTKDFPFFLYRSNILAPNRGYIARVDQVLYLCTTDKPFKMATLYQDKHCGHWMVSLIDPK